MKNILMALFLALFGFGSFAVRADGVEVKGASAAEKNEVIKLNESCFEAWIDGDLEKLLPLLHPEYKNENPSFSVDYEAVQFTAKLYRFMEQLKKPEAKLVDFVEFGMITRGQVITDEQRKHFADLENTPQGARIIRQMREVLYNAEKERKAHAKKARQFWNKRKLISCTGDSRRMEVVIEMPSATAGKTELTTSEWVKLDGKWLILKSVTVVK